MKEKSSGPSLHRDWIDDEAIEIVRNLSERRHTTFLVGGCVRDLLVGMHPKDYDIATLATPEEVKRAIRRSYIIGRRFRLVLVRRGEKMFEVATFRRDFKPEEFPEGAPPGDNVFGTPEEDAKRRDFTLNALFYDPIKDNLVDYVDGIPDIQNRIIRMIGEPVARLQEDPIRILRALRLAHKLNFKIESNLRGAMQEQAATLLKSVLPRKREEYLKILRLAQPELTFIEAHDLGILPHTLPSLTPLLSDHDKAEEFCLYMHRFSQLPVDTSQPVFLFGALMLIVFRLLVESDPQNPWRPEAILDHPALQKLITAELGMFKSEAHTIARALTLQSTLAKGEEFWRKGQRRRAAVLRDESFPLALMMAEMDCVLPPAELQRWQDEFQSLRFTDVRPERFS